MWIGRILCVLACLIAAPGPAHAQGDRIYALACARSESAVKVQTALTELATKVRRVEGRIPVSDFKHLVDGLPAPASDCRIIELGAEKFKNVRAHSRTKGAALVIAAYDPGPGRFVGFALSTPKLLALVRRDQIFKAFIAETRVLRWRRGGTKKTLFRVAFGKELKSVRLVDETPELKDRGSVALAQGFLTDKFGLDTGIRDGTPGLKTAAALAAYRKRRGLGIDGRLTRQTLNWLRFEKTSKMWAAVAFTARGAYAAAWRHPNRLRAVRAALAKCRKYERRGVKCATATASGRQCLAVASYRSRTRFGAVPVTAPSLLRAGASALGKCPLSSISCRLVTTICADGRHAKKL